MARVTELVPEHVTGDRITAVHGMGYRITALAWHGIQNYCTCMAQVEELVRMHGTVYRISARV